MTDDFRELFSDFIGQTKSKLNSFENEGSQLTIIDILKNYKEELLKQGRDVPPNFVENIFYTYINPPSIHEMCDGCDYFNELKQKCTSYKRLQTVIEYEVSKKYRDLLNDYFLSTRLDNNIPCLFSSHHSSVYQFAIWLNKHPNSKLGKDHKDIINPGLVDLFKNIDDEILDDVVIQSFIKAFGPDMISDYHRSQIDLNL